MAEASNIKFNVDDVMEGEMALTPPLIEKMVPAYTTGDDVDVDRNDDAPLHLDVFNRHKRSLREAYFKRLVVSDLLG
ncbi:hypothetical protein Tcan_11356 [Toxocara canis]|uniref:Uncharacterized protein n=1 Tax=Toxocara canis TaxID=6265 RepID=A0A0B2VQM5_TOXCA|nr:hypothetical protein Tcan_11356 [Toxocara canis]